MTTAAAEIPAGPLVIAWRGHKVCTTITSALQAASSRLFCNNIAQARDQLLYSSSRRHVRYRQYAQQRCGIASRRRSDPLAVQQPCTGTLQLRLIPFDRIDATQSITSRHGCYAKGDQAALPVPLVQRDAMRRRLPTTAAHGTNTPPLAAPVDSRARL